jgi:murein DD-endopeptidase MepM/ murein hydrolase activator NlpD
MSVRTVLPRVVTVLCLAVMLLPAAVVSADPRTELDEVQRKLEEARQGLDVLESRRKVTVEDLTVVDARRAELDAQLAGLNAELAEAESMLAAAEARLAATTQELLVTEARLADTRAELAHNRAVFSGRARASYMRGGVGYATAVLEVRDVNELARSVQYVRAVLDADRSQVEIIAALERRTQADADELERLQDRQVQERVAAQAERDRRAGVVAEREEVRGQVATEAARHRELLARIEADQESYEALVASLEAESASIEAELRRIQEEERRRAEANRQVVSRADPGTGQLRRPSDGRVTSGYGWRTHPIFGTRRFHAGVDFGAPTGAPIYAAEAGTVHSAGVRGGYGNTVVIDHGGGLSTLYAHMSSFAVSSGQRVTRGQVLGGTGCTGYCTGPHLHFEVRVYGEPRDPMNYL